MKINSRKGYRARSPGGGNESRNGVGCFARRRRRIAGVGIDLQSVKTLSSSVEQ